MSFFDDIENDIINTDVTDDISKLYKITSLYLVNNAKNMVEYIFNIFDIDNILSSIYDQKYNYERICEILSNVNTRILENNIPNRHYKIHDKDNIITIYTYPEKCYSEFEGFIKFTYNSILIGYFQRYCKRTIINMSINSYITFKENIEQLKNLLLPKFDGVDNFVVQYSN